MDSTSTTIAEGKEISNSAPTKKEWIEAMIQREATPKPERMETTAQFAEKYGISESTYNYQKNKKENKKKIIEIWLNEAIEGGNEVLKKLKENALAGKEKSLEMYLKFVLELAENLDIKSDGQALSIRFSNLYNGLPRTTSEASGDHTKQSEIQSN